MPRLAIVATHPIQHFAPLYRALAAEPDIELCVFFGAPIGVTAYFDREMNTEITWNADLTGGYRHVFIDPVAHAEPSFRYPNSPGLARHLSAFDPDAVIVYGYAQASALRALWWSLLNRRPVMMIGDSEGLHTRASMRRHVKRLIVPRILSRCAAFLSVGDENDRYYRDHGVSPSKLFRSPFPIDEISYRRARANRAHYRGEVRRELGIADDAFVALCVGKLSGRKRPADLIAAAAQLVESGVVPLFAGNGLLLDAMKAQADRLGVPARFMGFVNVDRLPWVYAAADAVVHASEMDPHPLVCSEAACVGLPMILSDRIGAVGPTDIARAGDNALVYRCGDIDALAGAIARMADDRALCAAMGARSVAIFDSLDITVSVTGVRAALDHVLDQGAVR